MDAAVDHQPLDLVEHRRVGGVAVGAIDPARRDDPDRRLAAPASSGSAPARCGCAAPSARSLLARLEIEGVVHRPRRMGLGHVERGEIVPVVLDLRPFGDREAEVGENLGQLVHHLADRVDRCPAALRARAATGRAARSPAAARARHPRAPPCAPRSPSVTASRSAWIFGPFGRARLGVHRAERLQQRGDRARLAERRDAHRLERGQVGGGGDLAARSGPGADATDTEIPWARALAGLSRIWGASARRCANERRLAELRRRARLADLRRCFISPARCSASCASPMRPGPITAGT